MGTSVVSPQSLKVLYKKLVQYIYVCKIVDSILNNCTDNFPCMYSIYTYILKSLNKIDHDTALCYYYIVSALDNLSFYFYIYI